MSKLADMIYEDLVARGKKRDTAVHWRTWIERFESVCGSQDVYGRSDIVKYLAWCRGQGFSQNAINTMMRPLKLLAQIQGWTYPKVAMVKVRDSDISRPILDCDEVVSLINRKGLFDARELALLAMATTYGMRREEMAEPDEPEIWEERTVVENGSGRWVFPAKILVHTVKGGVETTHLVPNEIYEVLKGFKPCGIDYMTKTLHKMFVKAGLRGRKGFGWHSIRRRLITELVLCDASAINIVRFIRWSEATMKGEFGMLAVYAKKDQARIDAEIFKVHPFLKYW